jgi:hypothetical protein
MRVYVGQTRSRALVVRLAAAGIGELAVRGELSTPPRRTPWAYDNGAFRDWTAGRSFDRAAFDFDVNVRLRRQWYRDNPPDFIVAPDVVAGGAASLAFSLPFAAELRDLAPTYLAVQDGMTADAVRAALADFDGLFVGGTLPWKLATGAQWVEVAHAASKPCHVGRVGTADRVRWAYAIGADSIDSALPLRDTGHLLSFLAAVRGEQPARAQLAMGF